jgi:hypothetical protein
MVAMKRQEQVLLLLVDDLPQVVLSRTGLMYVMELEALPR